MANIFVSYKGVLFHRETEEAKVKLVTFVKEFLLCNCACFLLLPGFLQHTCDSGPTLPLCLINCEGKRLRDISNQDFLLV